MTGWTNGAVEWSRNDFETYLAQSAAGHARQPRADQPGGVCAPVHGHPLHGDATATATTAPPRPCFTASRPTPRRPCACLPATCSLPDASSNSYAFSELPFREAPAQHGSHQLLSGHDAHRQQPRRRGPHPDPRRGQRQHLPHPDRLSGQDQRSGPQCPVCRVRQRHLRQPGPGRQLPGLDQHRFHVFHQPPRPADGPGESLPARQRLCPRRHGRQPHLLRRRHL